MSKLAELHAVADQVRSEVKVNKNGEGSLSIRALARICDVNHKTLVVHFSGGLSSSTNESKGVSNSSKLFQTLAEHGFQPMGFGQSGVPDIAAYLVVNYYAYDAGKNCTEFAKVAQKAIGAIGMRQWCREVTGWEKENPAPVTTDMTTVASMFSRMMEMDQKMNQILVVAEKQVAKLTEQVEEQKQITAEKQEIIDDMVEKEIIREAKFLQYPGLKEATDYALSWNDEDNVEIFFTLKQFCDMREIELTRGQKIQVGKLATDFCRLAIMRKLPKNVVGHTLYSTRFEPMVKLAVVEVLGLAR